MSEGAFACYHPSCQDQWEGRVDSAEKERVHQVIAPLDLRSIEKISQTRLNICFVGFCCDEGVRRNKGRQGAAEGPKALRKSLGNFPTRGLEHCALYDIGDIVCRNGKMEEAQEELSEAVYRLHKAGMFPIVFGGGHEIAWGHFRGIDRAYPEQTCSIVNFDAHFDLRPLEEGTFGTSGTSFRQIAELCLAQGKRFNYLCVGTQNNGNTKALFDSARELTAAFLLAEELYLQGPEASIAFLDKNLSGDRIYCTICMDVLAAAFAPGVSSPSALGIMPWQIIPVLRKLASSGKVVSLDVAEVAPRLDQDYRTAKLAASLIYEFLLSYRVCTS